jgi:hypothetical protein
MPQSKANIGPRIVLEGEKEYKQSITSVNNSMKVLKSELNAVSAEFDGNANSVEALRVKNELLLRQQTEQEKKLELLRGALDAANNKYGEGSAQVQKWQVKLNDAYTDLQKLNKEINSNTNYLKEAENSTDQTAHSIDKYGKEVKQAGDSSEKAGGQIKSGLAGPAIVAGVAALGIAVENVASKMFDLVKSSATYADEILTLSAQTGIATDTLQELKYMEELTDVSLETVTKTMAKQIKSMASAQKGTEDYVNTYRKLGIEVTNADGSLRNSNEVYWEVIDALGQMSNETERDANAMMLLGKSAQEVNPMIEIGSTGMAEFSKEAQNMGSVLSNELLQNLGDTDDALQRLYQQLEISKREVGADIAPAMTKAIGKVTEKIDEVDGKFAGFAEGALENVSDGFLWMIDNADKIAAGLQGIAAAIITKKAADGVSYAVTAYKTLTAATTAATAAQTGFNVASKASVIGAIASLVVGAGTALYSYAKSANAATEETKKLTDETYDLIENSQKVRDTVQENIEDRKKSASSIEAEANATQILVDSLYDLSEEEIKTVGSKEKMLSLVEQINQAMPDLNLTINEQTGLLSKQREEVEKLVQARIELSTAEALKGELSKIALDKYNQEQALNDLLEVQKIKREELNQLEKEAEIAAGGGVYDKPTAASRSADITRQKIKELNQELNENKKSIRDAKEAVTKLGLSYEEALDYIGDHSEIESATNALDGFLEKYKETLDEQNEAYADGLNERVDSIDQSFDASEKALDRNIRTEQKALKKAQEQQIKIAEDASEAEIKILEEEHKKKLALIDEEYLEKMKLVDEDRYKKLKQIQDQIDGIDAQSEAEERASKLKEESETRAELTARIASAKTAEERLEAQKDLTEFEEDTAKDRLKIERELQKDILENQKDTINDEYDAKIKALEKAQKAEEEKSNATFENEKADIAERLESKKQEIADIQELEMQALDDKQEAQKEALQKQKENAIQSAKDTYAEDLAEFKLNNALKYEEAVNNEEKINNYLAKQARSSMLSYDDLSTRLNNSSITSFDKLYDTTGYSSKNTSLSIDYDRFGDALIDALKTANLDVVLNGKVVGKLINKSVDNSLR